MKGQETSLADVENSDEANESPVTVMVRARGDQWHLTRVADDVAMGWLAAVSLDPRSLHELQLAGRRYFGHKELRWKPGSPDDLGSAGEPWVLIDMDKLEIVGGNGFELPQNNSFYEVASLMEAEGRGDESDERATKRCVHINLAPYWQLINVCDATTAPANKKYEAGTQGASQQETGEEGKEVTDKRPAVRAVLFGRALVEFVAHHALGTVRGWLSKRKRNRRRSMKSLRDRRHRAIVAIHRDWLMSPREDLNGSTPRKFLHGVDAWIEAEMNARSREWSRTGKAPPPVERDTHLYQFGAIGPWERMVYFDLVRDVIRKAFLMAEANPQWSVDTLADELAICRNDWLRQPYEESAPETGLDLIEAERRRMPLIFSESHILDCDCPICQAMANQSMGAHFLMFDGSHMELDGEFAFSNTESFEDWKEEQGIYAESDFEPTDSSFLGQSEIARIVASKSDFEASASQSTKCLGIAPSSIGQRWAVPNATPRSLRSR